MPCVASMPTSEAHRPEPSGRAERRGTPSSATCATPGASGAPPTSAIADAIPGPTCRQGGGRCITSPTIAMPRSSSGSRSIPASVSARSTFAIAASMKHRSGGCGIDLQPRGVAARRRWMADPSLIAAPVALRSRLGRVRTIRGVCLIHRPRSMLEGHLEDARAVYSPSCHWSTAASSPASPPIAIARFFEVWNLCQSRASAKVRRRVVSSARNHDRRVRRAAAHRGVGERQVLMLTMFGRDSALRRAASGRDILDRQS